MRLWIHTFVDVNSSHFCSGTKSTPLSVTDWLGKIPLMLLLTKCWLFDDCVDANLYGITSKMKSC